MMENYPSEGSDRPKNKIRNVLFGCLGIFAISIIIAIAVSGDDQKKAAETTNTTVPTTNSIATYDVPSLIGKNIDGIEEVLGTPVDDTEPTEEQLPGASEWWKSFERDGKKLLVTYRTSDRSVVDFFLTNNDSGTGSATTQEQKQGMLNDLNVTTVSSKYSTEFVKALTDPTIITGLKVTPN